MFQELLTSLPVFSWSTRSLLVQSTSLLGFTAWRDGTMHWCFSIKAALRRMP